MTVDDPEALASVGGFHLSGGPGLQHRRRLLGRGDGIPEGRPKVWVEQLTELTVTSGASGYILYRAQDVDVIRQFARQVAPALRESVEAERARGERAT